jgi:NADH dehydrogenase
MLLLCGGTGQLGGAIATRLVARGVPCRALVRPRTDGSGLARLGVTVVPGDLTDLPSLDHALRGVDTVVTTANAIGRLLAGATDLSIDAVDGQGNANLVAAAVRAGVQRFVFVSMAGIGEEVARHAPLAAAKLQTEQLLHTSRLREVVVRPDKFQEVWMAPETGIDPRRRRAVIYGRGRTPAAYVAVDDVAELVTVLAEHPDPPRTVEFGGPEALTRRQVVEAFEQAFDTRFRRMFVPPVVLAVGSRVLARRKPELASVMGLELNADRHPPTWDAEPLRAVGVDPRPASTYIASLAADAAARR